MTPNNQQQTVSNKGDVGGAILPFTILELGLRGRLSAIRPWRMDGSRE